MKGAITQALLRDKWFSLLSQPLADAMAGIAQHRRFKRGDRICTRGEPHSGMFFLNSGAVHVLNHLKVDKGSFLARFDAPMWFGEIGLLDDGPHSHDVFAHSEVTTLYFARDSLLQVLESNPCLWQFIGRLQAANLRLAYFLIDEFSGMSTEMRLARRIIATVCGHGMRVEIRGTLRIRQELLAQSLGVVRASITPILQKWRGRGIVELSYGHLAVLDMARLMAVAGHCEWPLFYKEFFGLDELDF